MSNDTPDSGTTRRVCRWTWTPRWSWGGGPKGGRWTDAMIYEPLTDDAPTPARRVWTDDDPEPGPEVTHVRDCDGDRWWREIETGRWYRGASLSRPRIWTDVLVYEPLTDDTPVGPTEPAPVLDLAADIPTPDAPWVPRIGDTVLVRATLIDVEDYELAGRPFKVELPGSTASVWVPAVERAQ